MSHDHRHDDPAHGHDHVDETRPVDRQQYDDGSRRVQDGGYVPPPAPYAQPYQPAGSQVNVNAEGRTAYVDRGRSALYYARRVLTLLFGILIVLIAIRIILLALGANETNGVVDFVFSATEPFVAPFRGIFSIDEVRPTSDGRIAFDIAAVVAAVGWLLIYMLLMAVLSLADRDRT